MIRTYSELLHLNTFEDRFAYLSLQGTVGNETFGYDRHINQEFYRSAEWRNVRNYVIVRDNGCDLAIPELDYGVDLVVHHMNPMNANDIMHGEEWVLDPEYLITTTKDTHNAVHYGGMPVKRLHVARAPGDTRLWG